MIEKIYKVLFVCSENSSRSILAEAILNRVGAGRFQAFSAGRRPKGEVHPMALQVLHERGYDTAGLRSKSWDEFSSSDAPALDFIFTVCDRAAGEPCPVWPSAPLTAHWGIADPAAFDGPPHRQRWVYRRTYRELQHRIELLTQLRIESLDRLSLQARLNDIGKTDSAVEGDGGER